MPTAHTDPSSCQACDQPLPATGAGDVCPACLMADALAPMDSVEDESPDTFAAGAASTTNLPDNLAGTTLGPEGRYKILQRIGEGGFGTVYMADQTAPVRRRVAIKVLKAGMDTRQVIARFEAERQALAMMDHPNIARIIDGGETDQGRPFFVMELVRGTPITGFCDEENLGTGQRLQLFIKVCGAVQHAHQKGVIHRDLKPSNILVTIEDGADPVPKVIDFGVAKAADAQLTDKTLFTRFEQMIGTPAYMSPEQAGARAAHDVDTRADIYALGVLLYELLTGTTPIEAATLKGAAFDEVRRILREDDAPRPSARLSSLELDRRTTIAKHRATEAQPLGRQLRGDLDWIVMKAIEKDRKRRYDTANALAADVERHLEDEPVSAGPPTAAYRTGKFLRRHKTALGVAAAMFLLLVAGIAATTWQAIRATAEKKHAIEAEGLAGERLVEAEAISSFLTGMFESSKPGEEGGGRTITVAESLKIAEKKLEDDREIPPERRAILQKSIASVYYSLGRYDDAIALQEKVRQYYQDTHGLEHPDTLASMHDVANSYNAAGRDEALAMHEKVLTLRRKVLGSEHVDTLTSMHTLAHQYLGVNRADEAIRLLEEEFVLNRDVLGHEHSTTVDHTDCLARAYHDAGYRDRALEMGLSMVERYEERLTRSRKTNGLEHPKTLMAMRSLADRLHKAGRRNEELAMWEEVLALNREVLGPEHPNTLNSMINLANSYRVAGRLNKALVMREQLLALRRKVLHPEHPGTLGAMHNLANSYHDVGRQDEALVMREEVLALSSKVLGPEHPDTLNAMGNLAISYSDAGRQDEALAMREEVLALSSKVNGPEHPNTLNPMSNLALSYDDAGRQNEALAMREEVLALSSKVIGPEHPDTLNAMYHVALSYSDAGRRDKAQVMQEEVLERRRKVLGPEHPDTLGSMHSLALSYYDAGRQGEALEMREEVLELRRKVLGSEHPNTLATMNNLANSYDKAGRRNEALEMREEVLELRRKVLDPKHPEIIVALINLGHSYHDTGRNHEALAVREQLLELSRKVKGEYHSDTDNAWNFLTDAYNRVGRQDELIELLEREVERRGKELGSDHPARLKAMDNLSISYSYAGRDGEALTLRKEVLALRRKVLGPEHPDTLKSMGNLAVAYSHAGRLDEAVAMGEEFLTLTLKVLGPQHSGTRHARSNLAEDYERAGRKDEASELFASLPSYLNAYSPAVTEVLVPPTSEWRWLHPVDGVDPAEAEPDFHDSFFRADYDDSRWQSGNDSSDPNGGFGYGDDGFTGVTIGTPAEKALGKSAYFRHRFTADEESTKIELRCHRDDGIIVYLDGREVARDNMSEGKETYRLSAESTVGDAAETAVFRLPLEGLTLPAGEHVLAISLHNTETPSSDLRIGGITLVEVE